MGTIYILFEIPFHCALSNQIISLIYFGVIWRLNIVHMHIFMQEIEEIHFLVCKMAMSS